MSAKTYIINWGAGGPSPGWNVWDKDGYPTTGLQGERLSSPVHLCEHVSLIRFDNSGWLEMSGTPEIVARLEEPR